MDLFFTGLRSPSDLTPMVESSFYTTAVRLRELLHCDEIAGERSTGEVIFGEKWCSCRRTFSHSR